LITLKIESNQFNRNINRMFSNALIHKNISQKREKVGQK